MNKKDREAFHRLLDYALDTEQDYVIGQQAYMYKDLTVFRTIYRLILEKTEESTAFFEKK